MGKWDLSEKGIKDIECEAIAFLMLSNTSLEILNMRNNPVRTLGAIALLSSINKTITLKKINDIDVGDIKKDSTMTHGNFNNKDLHDFLAILIAEILKTKHTLTAISLHENKIGDSGAIAIGHMLEINTSLQNIDMRENPISKNGAIALLCAINKTKTLKNINGIDVGDIKKDSKMTHGNFNNKNISDFSAIFIAEILKLNTSLTEINMNSNKIGDKGAKSMADALKENTTLKYLNLVENMISDEGAKNVLEALKFNTIIEDL